MKLSDELQENILSLCQKGKKLEAVCLLMQKQKWTLKESKDYVDRLIREVEENQYESQSLDEIVMQLCLAGKKIEAIKLIRKKTGLGLKESKEYVESLIDN